ncbi:MAG: hypothetical protein ACLFRV_09840 [Acidimicrobiales bacterium]
MSRSLIERRLVDVTDRLRQLNDDLRVHDEQLAHFVEEADDARLRSLVSETPLAEQEHREAARHAAAMERGRDEVAAEIARLESLQDSLLDQLQSLAAPREPRMTEPPAASEQPR